VNKVARFLIAGTIFILVWTTLFLKFVLPYMAATFFGFGGDLPISSTWAVAHPAATAALAWGLVALPFLIAVAALVQVFRRQRRPAP
jgi:type II secretory pathway component PulF